MPSLFGEHTEPSPSESSLLDEIEVLAESSLLDEIEVLDLRPTSRG
jgi:hypothetical protein